MILIYQSIFRSGTGKRQKDLLEWASINPSTNQSGSWAYLLTQIHEFHQIDALNYYMSVTFF